MLVGRMVVLKAALNGRSPWVLVMPLPFGLLLRREMRIVVG